MIFRALKVARFKRIPGVVDIDLRPGVNVFLGENNSGKTSAIEALALALAGYTEPGTTLANFVNADSGEKSYEIVLDFLQQEIDYRVELKAGTQRTQKILTSGGQRLAESATGVQEIMASIADVDMLVFSSIALQHRTTSVIFDDPAPRMVKLKTILGMETVGRAVDILKDDAKKLKDKEIEIRSALKTRQTLTFDLKPEPDCDERPDILQTYEASRKAYETHLKLQAEFEKANASHKAAQREHALAVERFNKAVESRKNLEEDIETREREIQKLGDSPPAVDIKTLETELQSCRNQESLLKIKMVSHETKLKLIVAGKCGECGQAYPGDPEPLRATMTAINADLETVRAQQKTLQKGIDAGRKVNQSIDSNTTLRKRLQSDFAKSKKALQDLVIPDAPPEFTTDAPKAPAFDMQAHKQLEGRAEAYQEFERELRAVKDFNEAQLKARLDNEAIVTAKTSELHSIAEQQTVVQKSRTLLEKNFSAHLLESGLAFVETRMNEFFQMFGGHHVSIKRDHKSVEFFFSTDGDSYTPAVLLGGAYRQILSMAFRLAICALQGSDFMILDEVDASTTEDKSVMLFRSAINFAPDIKQWIIITHRQDTVDMLTSEFDANIVQFKSGTVVA